MKQTRILMDMPITVEAYGSGTTADAFEEVYAYFRSVDARFSTFKHDSEISKINRGELLPHDASADMREVLLLGELTRRETDGYFDMETDGMIDPLGLVKGWAIRNAAGLLTRRGITDYYVDAGGDIQTSGANGKGNPWQIGIRNPFDRHEVVKVIRAPGCGVATSGTAIRGQHIRNPKAPGKPPGNIVSLTVIGPDIFEADRFATAAFAMGNDGISFIGSLPGFAGYMIDASGTATFTPEFERYVVSN